MTFYAWYFHKLLAKRVYLKFVKQKIPVKILPVAKNGILLVIGDTYGKMTVDTQNLINECGQIQKFTR